MIRVYRPLAALNLIPPALIGFGWPRSLSVTLAFLLVWVAIVQGVVLAWNDLADEAADDERRTLVSGGSGVLQEGLLSSAELRVFACGLSVALIGWGALGMAFSTSIWLASPFALLLVWTYSGRPLRLAHRGGGEIVQGLALGVGLPWLGAASAGVSLDSGTYFSLFLLGCGANISTAFPDLDVDRDAEKRTLVVSVGVNSAAWIAFVLYVAGSAWHSLVIACVGGVPLLIAAFVIQRPTMQKNYPYVYAFGLHICWWWLIFR